MEFDSNKPIFLQICDDVYEKILTGRLERDQRIPSVRDYGAEIGVNPNTVMRAYEKLTGEGVIYNKRGIGYFISMGAREIVLTREREEFLHKELPEIRRRMELLGISPDVLSQE